MSDHIPSYHRQSGQAIVTLPDGLGRRRDGLPHWHPNQLRHAKATEIRREYGLDAARALLGRRGFPAFCARC